MAEIDFIHPRIGREWDAKGMGFYRDAAAFERFASIYREAMALLPVPDEQRTVTTSFGEVRAYRFGDGPGTPLLLLPGRNSCTPLWRTNLPGLMRGRAVYSVDGLGEPGCSSQSRPLRSASDQVAWLDETITGLGLSSAHVLGVSIGGWLAVQTAIHCPERVSSIITLDPAMTFARLTLKVLVISLGSVLPGMPDSLRQRLLGWISGGVKDAGELPEGRLVASGMRDFATRFPAPALPSDEELRSIDVPALVLIAGRSIIHDPQAAARRARALLRRGTVEVWPDASHAINGEFPEQIADRVERFLAEMAP